MKFTPAQIKDRFRFAVVGHTEELAQAVRQCIDPEIEDVTIKVVTMGEAIPTARALFAQGVEVILGHMGSSRLMRQATEQPVVNIPRSRLDLIIAFQKAMQFGTTIGLTSYAQPTDGMEIIESLLGIRVHQILFHSFDEMQDELAKAYAQGVLVFVGGGISRKIVQDLGGRHVVPLPRPSVVCEALREARSMAHIRRRQIESEVRIRTILQEIEDGVIGIDQNGKVDIYNKGVRRIFELPADEADNRVLAAIARKTHLPDVMASGTPVLDEILKLNQTKVILRTLPIKIDGKPRGAVTLMREVANVENLNRKVRERLYKKGFVAKHSLADLESRAPAMQRLLARAAAFALTDATVFIGGETGAGKDLLAQGLHNHSPRRDAPFVAVNCAALPEQLLESELFGYEEGAFTGARRGGKIGLFEMAHGGTIFLDEIGDIPRSLQVRLLRVLETKEVMRVGGDKYVPVDVRILSASHQDLRLEVAAGHFRADLYYRLAVLRLNLPPLRERLADIARILAPLLARYGRDASVLSEEMANRIRAYRWPGNIRELTAVIESYLILLAGRPANPALFFSLMEEVESGGAQTPVFPAASVIATPLPAELPPSGALLKDLVEDYERSVIEAALRRCEFNRAQAARQLGISTNTLWRKYTRAKP